MHNRVNQFRVICIHDYLRGPGSQSDGVDQPTGHVKVDNDGDGFAQPPQGSDGRELVASGNCRVSGEYERNGQCHHQQEVDDKLEADEH